MEFFLFWFFFSVICGVMAGNAGRSGFGYFVLAMLISPLLCFILLAVLGKAKADEPSPETHIRCPDCRELIIHDARVCKHCGCKLIPPESS
jgi:hypothetical protein